MEPELIGGRYRVLASAGKGGMGTVWLCLDERLHREVAVKQVGLLPDQSVTDAARAFREARSSAGLNHRNVVTVFDVIEQDDHIWLVMEHVPGRSLSQIIREDGALDPRVVARIGAQVADGLAAAHAAGTSHRDVKPGNVLVRDDGVAKISDFGIARTHGDPALTQSGFLTGTPTYFSPELARGGEPGLADDVWALGATLYAAVEGQPLVEQHPNPITVLHDIASGRRRPPERAGFLAPVLQTMLDPDPEARGSMADASRRLEELANRPDGDSGILPTRELRLASDPDPATDVPTQAHRGTDTAASAGPVAPTDTVDGSDVATRAVSPGRMPPPPPAADAAPLVAVSADPASPGPPHRHPAGAGGTAAPPPERTAPPGGGGPLRAARRPPVLLVVAGVLAVLLLAALAWVLTRPDTGSGAQAGRSETPSPSPSVSRSPGRSASSSATPSTRASSSVSASTTSSAAAGSAAAEEKFVRAYYAAAPGGTDRGWAMLGPGEKAQGRGAYDGFWRTIRSVEVRSANVRASSSTVDVTLVYRTTSGGTSTERKRERLVPDGRGGYLLDSDVPAG
ncbi:hypothetical protein GCM10027596_11010 [Nocardioides korecus]